MTEAQIDAILEWSDYFGATLEELVSLFPGVDWAEEGRLRSEARRAAYAARDAGMPRPRISLAEIDEVLRAQYLTKLKWELDNAPSLLLEKLKR